jgi:hypothetical protein
MLNLFLFFSFVSRHDAPPNVSVDFRDRYAKRRVMQTVCVFRVVLFMPDHIKEIQELPNCRRLVIA